MLGSTNKDQKAGSEQEDMLQIILSGKLKQHDFFHHDSNMTIVPTENWIISIDFQPISQPHQANLASLARAKALFRVGPKEIQNDQVLLDWLSCGDVSEHLDAWFRIFSFFFRKGWLDALWSHEMV